MGYGSQANNIIKANRALLKKKRTFKEIRDSYVGYASEKELEFKKLTSFEQKKIRNKIKAQARKNKLYNIKVAVISWLIIALLIFGVYLLLS